MNKEINRAIWLNKEEKQKIKEIFGKLKLKIKEVADKEPAIITDKAFLEDLKELEQITTTPKEMGATRTHMITATVIGKTREKYKGGNDSEGKSIKGLQYWRFELDNRDKISMFHDVLDNPAARIIGSKEYDEIASSITTGNKYEFEVEKFTQGWWRLRNAKAL